MTAKASNKRMKNLARHMQCKHQLLLQESFINQNNENFIVQEANS